MPPIESVEVATSSKAVPAALVYNIRLPVMEERPVPPFVIGRVPEIVESVVVATHVGIPETRAKTKPSVVAARLERMSELEA